MGYIIDKVIGEFDYGHNVWVQNLDEVLSCGSEPKCLRNHGHRGKVVAYLEADELSSASNNMVIDFNDMKIMTKWIDNTLDHNYLIDINDPGCEDVFHHFWKDGSISSEHLIKQPEGHWIINPESYSNMSGYLFNKYRSYILLPFVPTSENLAKWMYDVMVQKMKSANVKVHKIEWYETPKSRATYYGE